MKSTLLTITPINNATSTNVFNLLSTYQVNKKNYENNISLNVEKRPKTANHKPESVACFQQ